MLPSSDLSKNQVDRLGDRLRKGTVSESDLRLLDRYRRSFSEVYEDVVGTIRDRLGLEPTGRRAKSKTSIIDKLQRESIRLSQMQDIAGCRVIVRDVKNQDEVIVRLRESFDTLTIDDRRKSPSHGYRAVHIIVHSVGKPIEIQVRTSLQHLWAELSEKFSDLIDPAIKYGGGDPDALDSLSVASEEIVEVENYERLLSVAMQRGILEDMGLDILKAQQQIAAQRKRVMGLIESMGEIVPED
jgi:putative GTP pyrophosphokinase